MRATRVENLALVTGSSVTFLGVSNGRLTANGYEYITLQDLSSSSIVDAARVSDLNLTSYTSVTNVHDALIEIYTTQGTDTSTNTASFSSVNNSLSALSSTDGVLTASIASVYTIATAASSTAVAGSATAVAALSSINNYYPLPYATASQSGYALVATGSSSVSWAFIAGGGGAGTIGLNPAPGIPSPNIDTEFESQVAFYDQFSVNSMFLYGEFMVPDTYQSGHQLFLVLPAYSPGSSGSFHIAAQVAMYRSGVDVVTAVESASIFRSTSTAGVSLSSAFIYNVVSLDVTDVSGSIGSVAVIPKAKIKVQVYRGNDTDVNQVRVATQAYLKMN